MTTPDSFNSFINRQFAHFLGVSGDRLEDGWRENLHPDDQARVAAEFQRCVSARSDYCDEFRLRRFDGEYRCVVSYGLPRSTPDSEFAGYAGSVVDVTERQSAEQRLRDANTALAAELTERTRSGEQIHALTARLINAQEEERTRLARELHDDLSQEIAAVSIATSHLKKKIPGELGEAIDHTRGIQEKLVHLSECVRRLSRQLHPSVLQHAGLAAALRNYCSETAALTSHQIVFRSDGLFDGVPSGSALCVYRVAQEAIQNSIRHSRVNEIEVELVCRDGALRLTVRDRGVGIDHASLKASPGLGLVSMQERSRLVNGRVTVDSRPGEGATIRLEVPLRQTVAANG
jgi:PAS domain S-box-containing protein